MRPVIPSVRAPQWINRDGVMETDVMRGPKITPVRMEPISAGCPRPRSRRAARLDRVEPLRTEWSTVPQRRNRRPVGQSRLNSKAMSKRLYLASQSPRRIELLRQVGLEPTVLPLRSSPGRADVDETPYPDEVAPDYVLRLARMKAAAGAIAQVGRMLPPWPILAADTTVTIDGHILGKPVDGVEAAAMLRRYSGRAHTVLTAVAAAHQGQLHVVLSESVVTFKVLSEAEIAAYVASREAFDKAGGYGIQGRAALFVAHLSGSYSGVMGLPLYETSELLKNVGFEIL